MRLDALAIPESSACASALEVATAYCSPALLNHSVRAYLWAAAYGTSQGIPFDPELLYVASMLHDIGLVREFDNHTVAFDEAGGHVAWVFGAGAGWPPARRTRLSEVIVRHMWDRVDVTVDAEGHLLERSTGLDICGRNTDDFSLEFKSEVLERYPRLGLAKEFFSCFRSQAARKPDSSAAASVRNGIGIEIAANPLDLARQV
ncbi:HD domain-containing protein [Streptomyces sp. RKAG293]|uniref:HD domain-containing protein n=1 Tax=Streptomyces sp. RKAG293 TaxID=2893403 RepID=UPI0020342EC5|nr:HD domain-containing protein [Streptomyces sp. RKAG293]MCM2416547.1 HD domain-containing protein [Streptomyces sp. RKAG293]